MTSPRLPRIFGCQVRDQKNLAINDSIDYNDIFMRVEEEKSMSEKRDSETDWALEQDPDRYRKFKRATTEQKRLDCLLKHCAIRLRPPYENALKKIQEQPGWEERFKDVIDLPGVEKLLEE